MTNIIVNDQTLLEPINLYCLPTPSRIKVKENFQPIT